MSEWVFEYDGFDPEHEGLRETLCTVGNGYFATRGAAPEAASDAVHHPGTYLAGVYNRLVSDVAGVAIENESLVNAPNWLYLRFRCEGGVWFGDGDVDVLDHHLELDMHRGVLTRRSRLCDPAGRVVRVTQRRFVSMRDRHLAALETTLVAENWSGRIEVRSGLDGRVRNDGVPRYADLDNVHLVPLCAARTSSEVVCLQVETSESHVRIGEAARTRLFVGGEQVHIIPEVIEEPGFIALQLSLEVAEGDEAIVEKIVAVFTSRDSGISEPGEESCDWATNVAGSFDDLLERHVVSWAHIWGRAGFELGIDGDLERALHLHLFHLLQTVSNNSATLDAGVPARGLHGEAYRGHIFWDELFILPYLSLRMPQLSRALLLYRYRRIDQARRAATAVGLSGAMFPWQSASNGRERTQTMHLNPKSGRWLSDVSHLQRHVNAAIVFNVWQYVQATGDLEFLRFYGGEMILEIARFWGSIATYNHSLDRYEITGVMGPDEYHEHYPDREAPGLDNNAYTNLLAVWCLGRAFEVLETLPPTSVTELRERLTLTQQELDLWHDISRKMRICFHDGVISQFEGFDELEELDWTDYRERYGNIDRLDRILEAEGDSTDRYKLTKQADVLMLFYVLSPGAVSALLDQLGYDADGDLLERNLAYYQPRTAHGSTLSKVVHAWVTARLDRRRSWDLFVEALGGDISDAQGGTTAEGIHLGAMAGTVDLLQRCYTGIEATLEALRFDPAIPEELGSLAFDVRYHGQLVHVVFTTEVARIRVDLAEGGPITVAVGAEEREVSPGELVEFVLRLGS